MQETTKSQKLQDLQALQADLKRQAKELDARAEYLDERERILQSGPIDLQVLEETIRVKKEQLIRAKIGWTNSAEYHKGQKALAEAEIAKKNDELREAQAKLTSVTKAVLDSEAQLKEVLAHKENILSEIAERKRYLDEQEKVIAEAIDEGNATLRGISYEIRAAHDDREQILQDVAAAETKKIDTLYNLAQIDSDYQQALFRQQEELERMQTKITQANKELTDLQTNASLAKTEVAEKMRQLDVRERELMTKKGALNRERLELEDDKRRWNSTKSLYSDTL